MEDDSNNNNNNNNNNKNSANNNSDSERKAENSMESINFGGIKVDEGAIQLTESMAAAKNLLEEMKDPLGINDSLYQYYENSQLLF